jgi:hypothetical protein
VLKEADFYDGQGGIKRTGHWFQFINKFIMENNKETENSFGNAFLNSVIKNSKMSEDKKVLYLVLTSDNEEWFSLEELRQPNAFILINSYELDCQLGM